MHDAQHSENTQVQLKRKIIPEIIKIKIINGSSGYDGFKIQIILVAGDIYHQHRRRESFETGDEIQSIQEL